MRRHSTTTEPYSQQWRMVRRSVCLLRGRGRNIVDDTVPERRPILTRQPDTLPPPILQSWRYTFRNASYFPPLPLQVTLPLQGWCTNEKIQQPKKKWTTLNMACDTTRCYFFSFFGSIFLFPFSFLFQYSLDNKTDKNYYFLPSGAYNIQTPFIISRHHGSVWPEKGRPNWISVCARGHKDSICHHYFLNILPMEWRAFPPTPEKAIFWTDPKMLKATLMARSNGQHEYLGVIKRTIKMVGKRDCK